MLIGALAGVLVVIPVAIGSLTASASPAQTSAAPRTFEVATVRLNPGPWKVLSGYSSSGNRLNLEGYTIVGLIMLAWDVEGYQVVYSNSGLQYYNVGAKAEGEATPSKSEYCQMLQTLLADRFQLKLHRETRETAVYAMVVGKNGPALRQSSSDASSTAYIGVNGRRQNMTLPQGTMDDLARNIRSVFGLDLPVVNQTGLTGTYEIKLEATPEYRISNSANPDDISVFDSIQKLGLRLEKQKANIGVLVVDHVEKPSDN